MTSINFNNIAILNIRDVIINGIGISEVVNLLKNADLCEKSGTL